MIIKLLGRWFVSRSRVNKVIDAHLITTRNLMTIAELQMIELESKGLKGSHADNFVRTQIGAIFSERTMI